MSDLLTASQCREVIAELAELLPQIFSSRRPDRLPFEPDDMPLFRGRWNPVFTGGGIVSMLITDPAAPPPSRTKDIDLVLEITGYAEMVGMEMTLRGAGFTQSWLDNVPLVSWNWRGIGVDFLPHLPTPQIQSNRWFPYLIEEAERVEVLPNRWAWRASAPCFLASKIEAFWSRCKGDYVMSKDIEDILAVVDGRPELQNELGQTHPNVRAFLAENCHRFLEDNRFLESLPRLIPDESREGLVFKVLSGMR